MGSCASHSSKSLSKSELDNYFLSLWNYSQTLTLADAAQLKNFLAKNDFELFDSIYKAYLRCWRAQTKMVEHEFIFIAAIRHLIQFEPGSSHLMAEAFCFLLSRQDPNVTQPVLTLLNSNQLLRCLDFADLDYIKIVKAYIIYFCEDFENQLDVFHEILRKYPMTESRYANIWTIVIREFLSEIHKTSDEMGYRRLYILSFLGEICRKSRNVRGIVDATLPLFLRKIEHLKNPSEYFELFAKIMRPIEWNVWNCLLNSTKSTFNDNSEQFATRLEQLAEILNNAFGLVKFMRNNAMQCEISEEIMKNVNLRRDLFEKSSLNTIETIYSIPFKYSKDPLEERPMREVFNKSLKFSFESIIAFCDSYSESRNSDLQDSLIFMEDKIAKIIRNHPINHACQKMMIKMFHELFNSILKVIDPNNWIKCINDVEYDEVDFNNRLVVLDVLINIYKQSECVINRPDEARWKLAQCGYRFQCRSPPFFPILQKRQLKCMEESRIFERSAEILWLMRCRKNALEEETEWNILGSMWNIMSMKVSNETASFLKEFIVRSLISDDLSVRAQAIFKLKEHEESGREKFNCFNIPSISMLSFTI
ncbi:unnamed protein product [Caenorhabditis bovis]|nr:unnamed protein product [Caenorhabditis bovis]